MLARARLFESIRAFFKERNVLEVETPLLCHSSIQDPHLHPIPALYSDFGSVEDAVFYLQTSPEFAMKRLLCAGIGPIYQICKAFRNGEKGKIHNPEFSMLEWYQPGYDHLRLMDEMDEFLGQVLQHPPAERIRYETLFLNYLNLNPFTATNSELEDAAKELNLVLDQTSQSHLTRDDWLNLLLSRKIEPFLGFEKPVMIYDFPASQAALAKINNTSIYPVAERFEVYIHGMELANGYHELTHPQEQLKRFEADAALRKKLNHRAIPLDLRLVSALTEGLPPCAGVALGLDRLLMIQLKANTIEDVLAFTIDRA